jgi:hypothetical protein
LFDQICQGFPGDDALSAVKLQFLGENCFLSDP